jgi:hypothetical protein
MEIIYKNDYKIVPTKYSWDLWTARIVTQESYEKTVKLHKKRGVNTNVKVGDRTWYEEGFYNNLGNLINTIIRLETIKGDDTVTLQDYLKRYKEMVEEIKGMLE